LLSYLWFRIMLFFRVILCVVGLLLYLVIREFSYSPAVPASPNALQQVPAPAVVEATPPVAPWDSANANIGTFQPVAAKPAAVP
jgi:hypothetical protein